MQTNKRKIGDTVYKPSGLEPFIVNRCLIIGIELNEFAITKNYNSWKKLDEYERGEVHQIEYRVIEEWREWLNWARYSEAALYPTREEAMEFVYKKAKEVLGIDKVDGNSNN